MIACPDCKTLQSTKTHRLQVKVGFSQFTCKECRCATSTKHWRCPCGDLWHKCEVHVQKSLFLQSIGVNVAQSVPKRGVKRFCTERGIEQPKPRSRKMPDYNGIAIMNSAAPTQQAHFLEPGTQLAAKSPHRVKRQRTQGRSEERQSCS